MSAVYISSATICLLAAIFDKEAKRALNDRIYTAYSLLWFASFVVMLLSFFIKILDS